MIYDIIWYIENKFFKFNFFFFFEPNLIHRIKKGSNNIFNLIQFFKRKLKCVELVENRSYCY